MIGTDPGQAAGILRGLAASQPGDIQVQANYLAALYRSHSAGDFDRALGAAKGGGVTINQMLKVPAFREAIQEESRLQRAKSPNKVLSTETMTRILDDLK